MISFNPSTALPVRTASVPASAATAPAAASTSYTLQQPRASLISGLVFAASIGLFGSVPALSGCGRTGLLVPEDDPIAADTGTETPDAGDGGTGGHPDAGTSDGGMDAGTPMHPSYVSDLDCDGVPDLWDNCPLSANADQADTDGDGIGDVCDNDSVNPDSDHDGLMDGLELFQLGTDPTKADSDGDGIGDSLDRCPLTPGPASGQGCQQGVPTCAIEAVPQPMTLCDGTMVNGFRILWNVGNAETASLKEGITELVRKHQGQVYLYPPAARTYEIAASSPFGTCAESVTVTP